MQIMNMIAAAVGITRIQNFMNAEEMAGVHRLSSNSTGSSGSSGSSKSLLDHRIKASNSHSIPAATSDKLAHTNGFRSNLGAARSPRSDSDRETLDTISSSAIQIIRSSFAWDNDQQGSAAALHDVQLEVPTGSLVIVVGPVGSGKSSLLNAVLGEMVALGGSDGGSSSSPVTVAGSVAYTAQVGEGVDCICVDYEVKVPSQPHATLKPLVLKPICDTYTTDSPETWI